MSKPKILVITSTVREGRTSRTIADWYIKQARQITDALDFELLDIADLQLPLFDAALPPMYHQYNDLQTTIAERIGSADGFVFITAEYNYSLPGSLKNFLDYIYGEWNRRPATFVGYGVHGGVRATRELGAILTAIGVPVLGQYDYTLHIDSPWEAFDEDGDLKAGLMEGNITKQLSELQFWVEAFAAMRNADLQEK